MSGPRIHARIVKATFPNLAAEGDTVLVELPANCAIVGLEGYDPRSHLRMFELAMQIADLWAAGEHKAMMPPLDELATLVKARRESAEAYDAAGAQLVMYERKPGDG